MKEAEVCKICKKGYITQDTVINNMLISKQIYEFIDCTNTKCSVHLNSERRKDNYNKALKKE